MPWLTLHRRTTAIALLTLLTGCSIQIASPPPTPSPSTSPVASSQPTPQPIQTTSQPTKAQNSQAVAFNNQGVQQLSSGNYQAALKQFNQAIQNDAKMPEAYLGRGLTYASLGNRRAAIKDYDRAILLNPKFAAAYQNRADEYVALGNKKNAIADLTTANQLFKQQGNQAQAAVVQEQLNTLNPPKPTVAIAATPTVTAEMALAMHLRKVGAKIYGTYWCSSCNHQKDKFGQAAQYITYIECDPRGTNARPDLCNRANISAYPTWEINGQYYVGSYPLTALADLSGYRGSRDFGG
ncbi:tetratricopeptide repeat protein [Pantanalinema rosaneae CENA516]|uniref:tetratricopeptide repeat protein n=1 Tax=Pantanalinema rosaneae TaxID=1620701 RepID=UPI003D6E8611